MTHRKSYIRHMVIKVYPQRVLSKTLIHNKTSQVYNQKIKSNFIRQTPLFLLIKSLMIKNIMHATAVKTHILENKVK